ncbi:MAG: cell division protein ZapA [Pseudohongiellaceae bacterium]|jgi:cell division protein ZapA
MAAVSVSLNILGRDYQLACPQEEEESLRRAARQLSQEMEALRTRNPAITYDKLAVMAALSITHQLQRKSLEASSSESSTARELKQLEKKIDNALIAVRQIEI